MKFNKKLVVTSILSSILISNLFLSNSSVLAAKNEPSEHKVISSENESVNFEELLKSGEYKSIKKIIFDEDGNPIGSEDIEKNRSYNNFDYGTYAIDRGDGWVQGKDVGFLRSLIVPPGMTGAIECSDEVETAIKVTYVGTASFTPPFITASIQQGYGEGVGNTEKLSVSQSMTAPKDKNLFLKAQSVFRRIDVVSIVDVVGRRVVNEAVTYSPSSYALKSIEFSEGEYIDQNRLYESYSHCILGDPLYIIKKVDK